MAIADGMMPPRRSWIKPMSTKSSLTMGEPSMIPNQKGSQMHLKDIRKSRYKARLVAGGHLTPDPTDSINSGVVSTRS